MATGTSGFPNRPYTLRIEVWYNWQSGTTASQHTEVWIDGCHGSFSGAGSAFQVYVDSVGLVQSWTGGFDFRGGCNFLIHVSDHLVTVNSNGDSGASVHAQYDVLGATSTSAWYDGTPPLPPNQPAAPSASNVLTTSMRLNWSIPGNNGNAIDQMLLRRYEDAAASGPYTDYIKGGGDTYHDVTGLTPGKNYYWAVYAHSALGYSARSPVTTQATLPATAPGMSVFSTVTGTAASFILTPPGGVSGVTNHRLERRDTGGAVVSTYNSVPPSFTVAATLVPGKSYDWRASVFIGSYQSPFTDWVTVVQANPNTNPGNYYDGGTTDTPATTYDWAGAAENSESTATALHPLGWRTFAEASTTSGGTGAVFRATGGKQGAWSARAIFFTDATAAGFDFGQSHTAPYLSDVDPLEPYFSSVFAWPSRSQRMRALIRWYDAAFAFISETLGPEVVVPAGDFTRLLVDGTAPSNAQWAVVEAEDCTGTGWSTWKGGDWLTLDASMTSFRQMYDYFDGDTADTTQYAFFWADAVNGSESLRRSQPGTTVDPLLDPDCPPIPAAPRPPTITDDCIEEVTLWRRYVSVIPNGEVAEWQSTLPTFELTTAGEAERQVRLRIVPNPFDYPVDQIDLDNFCSEQIVSYLPPNTKMTIDAELERVFAEVDGGPMLSADHLLYGTGGVPPTWPDLSCGISYIVLVDVPPSSLAGNLDTAITLTRRA
jgi:hypothetical protein